MPRYTSRWSEKEADGGACDNISDWRKHRPRREKNALSEPKYDSTYECERIEVQPTSTGYVRVRKNVSTLLKEYI